MHADQSPHNTSASTSATPRYDNTSTLPAAASTTRTAALMANPQTQQWSQSNNPFLPPPRLRSSSASIFPSCGLRQLTPFVHMRRGEMLEFLDYLSFMQDEHCEWRRDPPARTVDDGENPTTALLAPHAPPLATSPASTTTTAAAATNTSRSSPRKAIAPSSFSTAPWSSDTAAWPELGIPSLSPSSYSSRPSHHHHSGHSLHLPCSPALPTEPAVPSSPTL